MIVDARAIDEVPLDPRPLPAPWHTPLYDAVGLLLDRAERHGGDDADQLVVILTDGEENASRRWDRADAVRPDRRAAAAGMDVRVPRRQPGQLRGRRRARPARGNVSNFSPTPDGVRATYDGLARTVTGWRGKGRAERRLDRDDFWGGVKEAEDAGR